jgi:hypothetical protein
MDLPEIDWLLPKRNVSHCRGLAVPSVQKFLGGCYPDPRIRVLERIDQHSNRRRRVAADLLAKFSRHCGPTRWIARLSFRPGAGTLGYVRHDYFYHVLHLF